MPFPKTRSSLSAETQGLPCLASTHHHPISTSCSADKAQHRALGMGLLRTPAEKGAAPKAPGLLQKFSGGLEVVVALSIIPAGPAPGFPPETRGCLSSCPVETGLCWAGGMIRVLRIPLALPRVFPALILSPQLMSLPSPAWPQRDEPPLCGTTTSLPPPSSDSDSGCALEEYLEPPADPAPPEVGSTQGSLLPAFPQPYGCHSWVVPAAKPPPSPRMKHFLTTSNHAP